jgi:hypothetical protein
MAQHVRNCELKSQQLLLSIRISKRRSKSIDLLKTVGLLIQKFPSK